MRVGINQVKIEILSRPSVGRQLPLVSDNFVFDIVRYALECRTAWCVLSLHLAIWADGKDRKESILTDFCLQLAAQILG